jgi:hypothetical protein
MEETTNYEDVKSSDEDNNDNYRWRRRQHHSNEQQDKLLTYKEVNQKLQVRREMEETASHEQNKQAVTVNKNRS